MNTIELAKQAGTAWSEILDEGYLDRFRALCVAERDKELMGVEMEPYATLYHRDGYFKTKKREHDLRYGGPVRTDVYTAEQLAAARLQATEQANERANKSWALMCEKMVAAARLQDQQRIVELTNANNSNHNYISKLHKRITELEKELDEQRAKNEVAK